MKLEDEIKQSKFQDEWQKALLNILYTGNWLTDNFMNIAKKFGINDQHYNVLRILRGKHPKCACPSEIKQVLINNDGCVLLCSNGLKLLPYGALALFEVDYDILGP